MRVGVFLGMTVGVVFEDDSGGGFWG